MDLTNAAIAASSVDNHLVLDLSVVLVLISFDLGLVDRNGAERDLLVFELLNGVHFSLLFFGCCCRVELPDVDDGILTARYETSIVFHP